MLVMFPASRLVMGESDRTARTVLAAQMGYIEPVNDIVSHDRRGRALDGAQRVNPASSEHRLRVRARQGWYALVSDGVLQPGTACC
jgi:hypothetical protein